MQSISNIHYDKGRAQQFFFLFIINNCCTLQTCLFNSKIGYKFRSKSANDAHLHNDNDNG